MIESQRRDLSAYYTPRVMAEALADWAIRSGSERLLEPSVGGGALLKPALKRARTLLKGDALGAVLACDIDPDAIERLRGEVPRAVTCLTQDFLALEPRVGAYDVVLANPPFTRNHSLSQDRRAQLRSRFQVKGAAGLWVYVLLHSIGFLARKGRLASIVPGSVCFTGYGRDFLNRLCGLFSKVYLYQLPERPSWEGGAQDRGAVVLAEGYKQGTCEEPVYGVWESAESDALQVLRTPLIYEELYSCATRFDVIAQLGIGAVTGANQYFLLNEQERVEFGLDKCDLRSIASRARHLAGLTVSQEDLRDLGKSGEKTWLLHPRDILERGTPVRNCLAQIPKHRRQNTVWLNKRTPWWRVETGPDCDALFTYMNHAGPRLSLAGPNLACTNTLHRVNFRDGIAEEARVCAALSFLSTFGQYAAEGIGRVYGGGVLKFELADVRRMPILIVPLDSSAAWLRKADTALRAGGIDTARNLADEALAPHLLGHGWKAGIRELAAALTQAREARRRGAAIVRHA